MSKNDKRYEKTEYLIKKTFFELVKNNEKVTVSKIAEIANIDRKTFYLHYDSIESLYSVFMKDAEIQLIEELDRLDFDNSKDHIKTFFKAYRNIFISYKDLFYAINSNKQFLEYIEFNSEVMPQLNIYLNKNKDKKDLEKEAIYNRFFSDALLKFQHRYIRGEIKLTLDEYFDELEKISKTFAGLYSKRVK